MFNGPNFNLKEPKIGKGKGSHRKWMFWEDCIVCLLVFNSYSKSELMFAAVLCCRILNRMPAELVRDFNKGIPVTLERQFELCWNVIQRRLWALIVGYENVAHRWIADGSREGKKVCYGEKFFVKRGAESKYEGREKEEIANLLGRTSIQFIDDCLNTGYSFGLETSPVQNPLNEEVGRKEFERKLEQASIVFRTLELGDPQVEEEMKKLRLLFGIGNR